MDFLKVLVKNNMRALPETIVTSFLNYLFCPEEDHGFGSFVLERFLCEFKIAPEGLTEPSDWRWPRPPKIHVIPEWPCGEDDNSNRLGNMDSLIVITRENKIWLYGIEVKIHDKSAKNDAPAGTQLNRYGSALLSITPEDFGDKVLPLPPDPQIKQRTLLYIVPGEANVWPREVERIDSNLKSILKVITWHEPQQPVSIDQKVLIKNYSMDKFLQNLLCACHDGSIPPPDLFVNHMLCCLRYAIESDFTYKYEVEPVFHSNKDFEDSLKRKNQLDVLNLIRKVNEESVHGKLYARSNHTSIGIPIAPKSEAPGYNTLCRIRTVNNYYDPEILDHIQIEIAANQKWGKNDLEELLKDLKTQHTSEGVGLCFEEDFSEHFHQNGKDNEQVWLVTIKQTGNTPATQDEVARDQMCKFFKWLRSAYTTGED